MIPEKCSEFVQMALSFLRFFIDKTKAGEKGIAKIWSSPLRVLIVHYNYIESRIFAIAASVNKLTLCGDNLNIENWTECFPEEGG